MKKKQPRKISLATRIEKLRDECEAALDELSERGRPSSVPAVTIRAMWMAKAAGNVFEAALLASKEGKRNAV